jgi:hypothetical protein
MRTRWSLDRLVETASNKNNFVSIADYVEFCRRFLAFIARGLQAVIVSQNESHYCFYQYKADGHFNITRPINSQLMYSVDAAHLISDEFLPTLRQAKDISANDETSRTVIRNSIYTIQQAIGATLDALPAGSSNTARKINGDLFERLIRLLILEVGVDCRSGVITVPVKVDGHEEFRMSYQHDLLLYCDKELKAIGSVKTSSKDRLDKIFIDKFLYSRLTDTQTPHIAIFLNDVQRKRARHENRYGINSTFLPGHFKGYTVKLCPLDGVYYCDLRPNMTADSFLRNHIRAIDHLFCDDLARLIK